MLKPVDVEPDLGPFEFFIDAYRELSTSRPVGLSMGAIPFTAIVEYSRIYDVGDFEDFHFLIRKLDYAFLEMQASKNKASGDKGGTKNSDQSNQSLHGDKGGQRPSGHGQKPRPSK